jgi:hypothetical protein
VLVPRVQVDALEEPGSSSAHSRDSGSSSPSSSAGGSGDDSPGSAPACTLPSPAGRQREPFSGGGSGSSRQKAAVPAVPAPAVPAPSYAIPVAGAPDVLVRAPPRVRHLFMALAATAKRLLRRHGHSTTEIAPQVGCLPCTCLPRPPQLMGSTACHQALPPAPASA